MWSPPRWLAARGGWDSELQAFCPQAGDIKEGVDPGGFGGKSWKICRDSQETVWGCELQDYRIFHGGWWFCFHDTRKNVPSQAGWPEPEVASCSCWSRLSSWKAQCGVKRSWDFLGFFDLILDWSWSVTSRLITCWLIILGLLWWFLIFYHYVVILLVKTL